MIYDFVVSCPQLSTSTILVSYDMDDPVVAAKVMEIYSQVVASATLLDESFNVIKSIVEKLLT